MKMIPVSNRISFFYVGRGVLETDGYKLVLRQGDELTHLPVAGNYVKTVS